MGNKKNKKNKGKSTSQYANNKAKLQQPHIDNDVRLNDNNAAASDTGCVFTRVKLYNISPMHIGTGKDTCDTCAKVLQSDTITAALASLYAQDGNKTDKEFISFLEKMVVSSAFPFYDNIYFLPSMQGKINVKVKSLEEHQYRKKLKKVKFIDEEIWKEMANGNEVEVDESQIQDIFIVRPEVQLKPFMVSQVERHAMVARNGTKDSFPFYFERIFFRQEENGKKYGLYFLMKGLYEAGFLSLLQKLGKEGIGKDRSTGCGMFEVEVEQNGFRYKSPTGGNTYMTLSLLVPKENEVTKIQSDDSATYSLVLRGGYMAGSCEPGLRIMHKKNIYAFDVGSMFSSDMEGQVVDLTPNGSYQNKHNVYRSGKALTLKIKR